MGAEIHWLGRAGGAAVLRGAGRDPVGGGEIASWQKQHGSSLDQKYGAELQSTDQRSAGISQQGATTLQQESAALQKRWTEGLARIEAPLAEQSRSGATRLKGWDDPGWKTW